MEGEPDGAGEGLGGAVGVLVAGAVLGEGDAGAALPGSVGVESGGVVVVDGAAPPDGVLSGNVVSGTFVSGDVASAAGCGLARGRM